jgi:splicing factor 3A subunit 3
MFAHIMDEVIEYCDKKFTAEEGNGRYLDLHEHYLRFCNIKKLRILAGQGLLFKADDYLTWLQNFDKLQKVPLYLKQTSKKYLIYLTELKDYLVSFFKKTQPLIEFEEVKGQVEEMFESEWEMCSLFGWEEVILRLKGQSDNSGPVTADGNTNPLYCKACNKTFANDNVFMHHKKGRPHIKAVNELSKKGEGSIKARSEFSEQEVTKLKTVALLETWILKLKQEMLADVF